MALDLAAEFAKRNAAKAAKVEESPLPKLCLSCGKVVGNPVCKDGTRGLEPYCFECWVTP